MNSLTGDRLTFKEIERSFFEIGCEVAKMLMGEFLGNLDKEVLREQR